MTSEQERARLVAGIERCRRHLAVQQATLDSYVQQLRAGGASWTDVADALGVTRQAARQKYGSRELVL